MKPGDLVFVTGSSFISKIIKAITKSLYTHVAIVVSDNIILEADAFKTVTISELNYDKYVIVSTGLNLTEKDVLHTAIKFIGKKYDYLQILKILLNKFLKIALPFLNIKSRYTCVELAVSILQENGISITADTPAELYKNLQVINNPRP